MATIDKLPSGLWRARVRRHGTSGQTKTFKLKHDAEGWAHKVESEIERGAWRDLGAAEATTLREALDRYAGEVSPRHRGAAIEQVTIGVMRSDAIASKPLADVHTADVQDFADRMERDGYAHGTVNRRLGLLGAVFVTAAKRWGMEGLMNPCVGVDKEPGAARARRVSDDELAAWVAGSRSHELGDFMRLLIETAMRRRELVGLLWKDVDTDQRTAYLQHTKNGSARTVPLSSIAVAILEAREAKSTGKGRVFHGDEHSFTTAARRALTRARAAYIHECSAAGRDADSRWLVDARLHDLRHEATSRLASRFQAQELAAITGHKDLRMLLRYYHADAKELAKRLD